MKAKALALAIGRTLAIGAMTRARTAVLKHPAIKGVRVALGYDRETAVPERLGPLAAPLLGLLGWVGGSLAAGGVGTIASRDAPAFYAKLRLPAWAPPASVFGPVWTTLYVLMGVAAWLVWQAPMAKTGALSLFGVQLAVNALWSWLFFAWHQGAWASVEVLVLLGLISATLVSFWRVSRVSGLLMVPYLAWVSFASVLTWAVWRGNPELL